MSNTQIYDFENNYISALCDAYAEVLSRDSVKVDDILTLPKKYQTNFYTQRKDIDFEEKGINVVTYHKDEKDGHTYGFMPSWRKDLPKEKVLKR